MDKCICIKRLHSHSLCDCLCTEWVREMGGSSEGVNDTFKTFKLLISFGQSLLSVNSSFSLRTNRCNECHTCANTRHICKVFKMKPYHAARWPVVTYTRGGKTRGGHVETCNIDFLSNKRRFSLTITTCHRIITHQKCTSLCFVPLFPVSKSMSVVFEHLLNNTEAEAPCPLPVWRQDTHLWSTCGLLDAEGRNSRSSVFTSICAVILINTVSVKSQNKKVSNIQREKCQQIFLSDLPKMTKWSISHIYLKEQSYFSDCVSIHVSEKTHIYWHSCHTQNIRISTCKHTSLGDCPPRMII